MGNLIDILTYVAPPVLLLLLGAGVRRAGWFKAEADALNQFKEEKKTIRKKIEDRNEKDIDDAMSVQKVQT